MNTISGLTRRVFQDCHVPDGHRILKCKSYGSIEFSERFYPRGYETGKHSHDSHHLGLVLCGKCFYAFGQGKGESYVAGELHYLPSGEYHSCVIHDNLKCVILNINHHLVEQLSPYNIKIESGKLTGGYFQQIVQRLLRESEQDDEATVLVIECLVIEMLVGLGRSHQLSKNRPSPALLRARDLLHERIEGPFSLTEIAAKIGMHPAHMAREFHKAFDRTMGEYLRDLRIKRAQSLLRKSDISLSEISQLCGFHDQSHFSRCFRQTMGVSPLVFRRQSKFDIS